MPETIAVRNPRTGVSDFAIEPCSINSIEELANELRSSQSDWRALGLAGRIEVMQEFKTALESNREAIVDALSIDTGRHMLANQELDGLMRAIDRWCNDAPGFVRQQERTSAVLPHIAIQQRHVPYAPGRCYQSMEFPVALVLYRPDSGIARGLRSYRQTQ